MEKKENLSKQLDCYLKYGDFSHPLVNVLRSALQFARKCHNMILSFKISSNLAQNYYQKLK